MRADIRNRAHCKLRRSLRAGTKPDPPPICVPWKSRHEREKYRFVEKKKIDVDEDVNDTLRFMLLKGILCT